MGSPVQDTWTYWNKSSKGSQRLLRDQSISSIRRGWDNLAQRSDGSEDLPSVLMYRMGWYKEEESDHSQK